MAVVVLFCSVQTTLKGFLTQEVLYDTQEIEFVFQYVSYSIWECNSFNLIYMINVR